MLYSSRRAVLSGLPLTLLLLNSRLPAAEVFPGSAPAVLPAVLQKLGEVSAGALGEDFGNAVAADEGVFLVGDPFADCSAGGGCGEVAVYERNGNTWVHKQTLTPSDPQAGAQFGASVAVQGGWAVIGAPEWDSETKLDLGIAYVFSRQSDGMWRQVSPLRRFAGLERQIDKFGTAVAIDARSSPIKAIVGVPGQSCATGGEDCGAVYVFPRPSAGSEWVDYSQSTPPLPQTPGSALGTSVAFGSQKIYAGAPGLNTVLIFEPLGATWTPADKIPGPDSSGFGKSLAFGVVDPSFGPAGDLLVGAPSAGKAFWYQVPNFASPAATLVQGDTGRKFGTSIALGEGRALVGAPEQGCPAGPTCGAAYYFELGRSGGTHFALLEPLTRGIPTDLFGSSVAIGPDYALVGAPDAGASPGRGIVTIYGTLPPPPQPRLRAEPAIAFGPHAVGSATPSPVTVTNDGDATLNVTSVQITGTSATEFTVPGGPFSLGPGESRILDVTFSPTSFGPKSARLAIFSDGGIAQLALSGQATTAGTAVFGEKTVFGQLIAGGQVIYQVTFTNYGNVTQPDNPGAEFTDTLPAPLTLVSASANSGMAVADPPTRTVTWNGSIPPLSFVTLTIVAMVPDTETIGTAFTNQGTFLFDADGNGTNESSRPTDDPGLDGTSDPTVFRVRPVPLAPTLNEIGLALLAALLGGFGLKRLRRRQAH